MNPQTKLLRLSIVLAIIGLAALWPVFCRGATHVEQERAALPRLYHLTGGSMQGVMPYDNWAMVWPVRYQDLKVGDVVLFAPPGKPYRICHMIVGRFGPLFVTKGTNLRTNANPDPFYCTPDNFIGVVRPK